MSNSIVLSILALTTVVAGKFKTSYAVVDQENNLVGTKAHATEAEAQAELGSLKFYTEGLAFARATAKEGTADKSLVGKANLVAAYLMYKEQLENPVVDTPAAPLGAEDTPAQEEF